MIIFDKDVAINLDHIDTFEVANNEIRVYQQLELLHIFEFDSEQIAREFYRYLILMIARDTTVLKASKSGKNPSITDFD